MWSGRLTEFRFCEMTEIWRRMGRGLHNSMDVLSAAGVSAFSTAKVENFTLRLFYHKKGER